MSTWIGITVIPDPSEVVVVDNSPGLARIDLGTDVQLLFEKDGSSDGLAALDALHEAITKAYELLKPLPAAVTA